MFCGKCGKEVPDGYEFCMNCGAKLEKADEQVAEIVKPKKKWIIPVVIVLAIIIVAVGAIYFVKDSQAKSGLYNNIAWGTSIEKIQEMVEKNPDNAFETIVNEEKTVVYDTVSDFYNFEHVTAMVTYECEVDSELHGVTIFIINGEDSSYTDNMIGETIIEDFDKLYGAHGEDVISKVWTTPKSKIALTYFAEGCLVLEYDDISLVED